MMLNRIHTLGFAVLLVVLFSISAAADPVINSFTASTATINAGETVTLSWDVTGADANGVTINNGIGVVASSGSVDVTPTSSTQYVLTATCADCTPPTVIFSGGSPGMTVTQPLDVTVTAAVTPVAPVAVTPVVVDAPTMNEWGMILLIMLMAGISVLRIRKMNQSK